MVKVCLQCWRLASVPRLGKEMVAHSGILRREFHGQRRLSRVTESQTELSD